MCTVTYIPAKNGVYFTSSRDESIQRKLAIPARPYVSNGIKLIYPKDGNEGGTWVALNPDGNASILLNGAFFPHTRHPPYRKSRGLILLEILGSMQPEEKFAQMDLSGIESFTLILFCKNRLWEYRWNGQKKFEFLLEPGQPYIWSSVMLYSRYVATQKEQLFRKWLERVGEINAEAILEFHQQFGVLNLKNIQDAGAAISKLTVSITSIYIGRPENYIMYKDLHIDKYKFHQCLM